LAELAGNPAEFGVPFSRSAPGLLGLKINVKIHYSSELI
jgi:hypothetical protein